MKNISEVLNRENKIQDFLNKRWSEFITENGVVKGLVSVDLGPYFKDGKTVGVWLSRVFTPVAHRDKGYARTAMKKFIEGLNKSQVDCYLTINSYGDMSRSQLCKWYRRLGFKKITKDGLFIYKTS